MEKSESIANLAKSLAIAQGAMKHAAKDSTNPHFKSRYADLASVVEAVREPLSKNGLSYSQLCNFSETGDLVVETILMHESGEFVSGSLNMPVPQKTPQGIGSAMTYSRRYSLMAIVGLAPDEDDDGNAASAGAKTDNKKEPKKETPKVELSDAQKHLLNELGEYFSGDREQMEAALYEHSHYEKDGKEGDIKLADLETPKAHEGFQRWVGSTLCKFRKWKEEQCQDVPF